MIRQSTVARDFDAHQIRCDPTVTDAKQITPALPQMTEEFLLQRQDQIVATVEGVVLHHAMVHTQQIGQGRSAKSKTVKPPLAARQKQPVNHNAQHLFPLGVLPIHRPPETTPPAEPPVELVDDRDGPLPRSR